MLEQSFFYNLFLSFASKFSHFYKQSLVGRFLGKISIFFSRLWHQSLLYKFFFGTSPFERGLERGVLGRLFNKGSREGAKSSKFFNPHLNKSRVLGFFSTLCESLLHVSLRSFGVLLFLAAAIPTASSFIAYGYAPLFFMAICGLGFVLLFLNRSIAQLYNGSFVLKKALGFFFVSEIKEGEKKHYLPLFAVLGLALGAVGHFGDMMLFIMAFGGLFGGILVLYRV
ncbi:MAG: hypothetical protein FWC69_05530, partial [Defluviitaleaceae bacterium]|nr:hypothetical protein [Defluviitaleaceae bacterium]